MKRIIGAHSGFTLIEVVITLVIGSILGTILLFSMRTTVSSSGEPIVRAKNMLALNKVMENIVADYNQQVASSSLNLSFFKTGIGAENSDQNNGYGVYIVGANHFIKFDGSRTEQVIAGADPQDTLKVTIRDASGGTVTEIFTLQ